MTPYRRARIRALLDAHTADLGGHTVITDFEGLVDGVGDLMEEAELIYATKCELKRMNEEAGK
jgi:hypothetical protein